jgi:DNA-binding transcriptional LysR family regulator
VRLLHRTTRRVTVSEEGERVYQWAQQIFDAVQRMGDDISAQHREPAGLRIASSLGLGRRFVAPALSELAERYPRLDIRLDVHDRLVDLIAEGVDLDIRVGNAIAPNLIAKPLARNRRVLCAAPAYLARRGTPKVLGELASHDCLVIKERDHPFGVWQLMGPDGEEGVRVTGGCRPTMAKWRTSGAWTGGDLAALVVGCARQPAGRAPGAGAARLSPASGYLGGVHLTAGQFGQGAGGGGVFPAVLCRAV